MLGVAVENKCLHVYVWKGEWESISPSVWILSSWLMLFWPNKGWVTLDNIGRNHWEKSMYRFWVYIQCGGCVDDSSWIGLSNRFSENNLVPQNRRAEKCNKIAKIKLNGRSFEVVRWQESKCSFRKFIHLLCDNSFLFYLHMTYFINDFIRVISSSPSPFFLLLSLL